MYFRVRRNWWCVLCENDDRDKDIGGEDENQGDHAIVSTVCSGDSTAFICDQHLQMKCTRGTEHAYIHVAYLGNETSFVRCLGAISLTDVCLLQFIIIFSGGPVQAGCHQGN